MAEAAHEDSVDGACRDVERQAAAGPGPLIRKLGIDDFARDPHAAKYRDELEARPDAFNRLFALMNDPANEQRLVDAEMLGLPALAGIARFVEADPVIARTLEPDQDGNRFRQTVGVAVRLKMELMGWQKTGRKGTVRGSRFFTKAERYVYDQQSNNTHSKRALAVLEAIQQIGDDQEREETCRELMEALESTRREEGRPF